MPPAIVYTDMAAPVDIGVGVFTDLKFFIVQRVPQRSRYVSLVENNGGTVVKLEAQADYLIADHIRHDVPADSLSYKFIEAAVKEGALPEDEEPYFANRRKSTNRASSAATSSKKSTRTPFTDEDDKLLYKLVQKANDQGYAILGNTLYQTLAAHNPRHTFHSWRDRYVKVLSMSPPTGWEAYPDANLPSFDTPSTDLPSTALPRSTARSAITSTPRYRVYTPYTDEDDKELEAWVAKKAKQGASLSGNVIYKELEAKNPRHSYHSWRDRWVRHLSLRDPADEDNDDPAPLQEEDARAPEKDVRPPEDEVTPARPSPPKPPPSKTPLKKRPSFRVPPGASAESSTNVIPRSTAPAIASSPKEKTPQSTIKTSTQASVTTQAATASRSTIYRAVANSKNQANTPMARSRNLSSPVQSQSAPAQPPSPQHTTPTQVRAQVSEPVTSRKAVQADIEPQSHDDSAFTEQDFELLLVNALDIQNVLVGRYQESWIKWAKFRNSHTAAEWRSFYERRVLPVVLQEGDGFERPESQRGDEWVEFWRNQGQPIDVLPYKSAYEVPSTSPNVAEKASTSAEQDKEMDDVVEQVGEVGENVLLESAKRKLPTPQDVVEEEPAQKRPRTATPPPKPVKDIAPVQSVPQLIAEGVVSVSSKEPPSPNHHSEEEEEEEVSEDQAAGQLQREMAEDKDDRHQLTRANLARIQAENGLPEEKRGVDIEADDPDDDQAGFATFLASMLPPEMREKALETVETHDHQTEQDDDLDEDEDNEDILMNNEQPQIEHEYDPALLEIDPELDNPSYQSSAEFQANNTNIHLDVPTTQPWEASSLPSQSQSQPQRHQRQSTQAIYDAETQAFDAEIPLPPDELYEMEEVTYTTAQTDSQVLAEDEFWPWIDAQTAAGYAEDNVTAALRATSFNPKLAAMILEAKGEQLDVAGIWSPEDDQIAEGRDAKAIRKLEVKHGKGSVEKRITFLSDWRRDEEIAMSGEVEVPASHSRDEEVVISGEVETKGPAFYSYSLGDDVR
jgi:hypothetical protein